MKTTNENPIQPMEDQPAKPVYIKEQHNHNCQQFFGNVTGCVFAMPGAVVNQTPSGVEPKASAPQNATCNPQPDKKSILDYVMQLHPLYVSKEWQDKYEGLWKQIMELPEVAETIYNPGRQKDNSNPDEAPKRAKFNRSLAANIICMMARNGILKSDNATELKQVLEGDYNNSVREQLGKLPVRKVKDAVKSLIE